MKRGIGILVSFLAAFSVVALFNLRNTSAGDEKSAFVNVAKVFDEYNKTKDFDKDLADKGNEKQAERDKLVQDVRRLKDEMALLSDDGKEEKQKMIDEKVRALQDFDTAAKRELNEKRDIAVKEILKDIDDVILDTGKNRKYDFIYNERALLYKTDRFDITMDILAELNKRYEKMRPKEAAKAL